MLPPESPGAWRPLPTLCAGHAALATLPNGQRLADVVRLSRLEVEGPGLPFLLPVTIQGKPAWTSWFGPSYCVHWPFYRGADVFELEVLHRPELVDSLCVVDVHERLLARESGVGALGALAAAAGAEGLAAVERLCAVAWRRDRYEEALRRSGKHSVDSMEEALEVMEQVEPCVLPPDQIAPRIPLLVELAGRRFAGHAQSWAWDFVSDRPMSEIREALEAGGPWSWIWRDKDAFGPYISAHPHGLRARIYDLDGYHSNGPTYTVEVGMRASCQTRRPEVEAIVRDLLARIGARDIQPGEGWD